MPPKLYHGTASTYLPSILANGIRPGGDGVVYLTDTQAIGFARMAVGGAAARSRAPILPVVLEIDATRLDPEKLQAFQRPAKDIVSTCAYGDGETIPPDLITRTATIDPARAPYLYREAWDAQVARGFLEKLLSLANDGSSQAYDAVSIELRNLIRWLFGEEPADFDGPPEAERAGVKVVEHAGGRA